MKIVSDLNIFMFCSEYIIIKINFKGMIRDKGQINTYFYTDFVK